jgi:hypothetical protein
MTDIEPSTLRALLSYDSTTGRLTWLERPLGSFPVERAGRAWNTRYAGRPAFARFDREGYYKGTLSKRTLQGHRVAWAIYYGSWPDGQIDHINGDRTDNRIANLRVVDHVENGRNRRLSKRNRTGVTGVRQIPGRTRWSATITVRNRQVFIGSYASFDAAAAARKNAERSFGFHQNHGRG